MRLCTLFVVKSIHSSVQRVTEVILSMLILNGTLYTVSHVKGI